MIQLQKFISTNLVEVNYSLPDRKITEHYLQLPQIRFTCEFTISPLELIWLKNYVGFKIISITPNTNPNIFNFTICGTCDNRFIPYIETHVTSAFTEESLAGLSYATDEFMINFLNDRLDIINSNLNSIFMTYMSAPKATTAKYLNKLTQCGNYFINIRGIQYSISTQTQETAYLDFGIRDIDIRRYCVHNVSDKLFGGPRQSEDANISMVDIIAGIPWADLYSDLDNGMTLTRIHLSIQDLKDFFPVSHMTRNPDELTDEQYIDCVNERLYRNSSERIYIDAVWNRWFDYNTYKKFEVKNYYRSLSDAILPMLSNITNELRESYVDNNT